MTFHLKEKKGTDSYEQLFDKFFITRILDSLTQNYKKKFDGLYT